MEIQKIILGKDLARKLETIFCSSDKLANHKKVIVDDDFHYIINITRKGKYCQVICGICKNVDVIKEITAAHSV